MLAPGSVIGILGGGQLGRMLAMAAARLGYDAHIYTPEKDSPASHVSRFCTVAEYEDERALSAFAQSVDAITLEFENIPLTSADILGKITRLSPSHRVLEISQHRVKEKEFINAQGIGTAPFRPVSDAMHLLQATGELGFPCFLKTCTLGYDGKGQVRLTDKDSPYEEVPLHDAILEGAVDFEREISVIVARSTTGEIRCFPPVHNIHKNQILHETHAPADLPKGVAQKAESIARTLAEALELEGLLAVEMFVTRDGSVLVNEMAPRPHNSGHWTLDACATSQFEQAIRAVAGLPLGDTAPLCASVMTNLLGDDIHTSAQWLQNPRAKLHLYGKAEAKPGRKMGHVTLLH